MEVKLRVAIIDTLGLCYDGDTLKKTGLGGSESAVIHISRELANLGFSVTVYNNCVDSSHSAPGIYEGVTYVDHTQFKHPEEPYDVVVVSRSTNPFWAKNQYGRMCYEAQHRVLWMHDTFCEGDEHIEQMIMEGFIDELFTLSDFHTNYILNCEHGRRRNFEVLKHRVFQTRNGAYRYIDEVKLGDKDPNLFVYNASATKGLRPLLEKVWPEVKKRIPEAKLKVIGGYYRFREGAEPDAQEKTVREWMRSETLKALDVEFTGVITQQQIAETLARASFTLYPTEFPETFGISTLESLLYRTPVITNVFGALEETAVDLACYRIPYSSTPNALFKNINEDEQCRKMVDLVVWAHGNRYLLQQKQNYCGVIDDVHGWDTIALQWKQHLYEQFKWPLPVEEYRRVSRINEKVARVFGRRFANSSETKRYGSSSRERRIVVISPLWNAADYVEDHILSVAQQDYDNYMHVLIDDASTDDSFDRIVSTLATLSEDVQAKYHVQKNISNVGAVCNQIEAIGEYVKDDDIVMLLDGDDWLVTNPTIFKYYNDLYDQGYEFTYGSMWSLIDDIPLIAQDYPREIKENKTYRDHRMTWGIPYTHLRTFLGKHASSIDVSKLKDGEGNWMMAGADNPLFYELIESVDPDRVLAVKEIIVNYNDVNPLNDYKIRGEEQNRNANIGVNSNISAVTVQNDVTMTQIENDVTWRIIEEDWNNGFSDMIERLSRSRNKTVVQAGGNQGLYPMLLSKYYDTVYTFEPNPDVYQVLLKNCTAPNIKPYMKGLGDRDRRTGHFNDQPNNCGKFQLNFDEDGPIEVITIDSLGLDSCDLIWLDIELKEYEALLGARETIKKFKPIIIAEGPETTGNRVVTLLEEMGYHQTDRVNNDSVFEYKGNETVKKILIAVPTNKYIEPETFKSIYDLIVPKGYETEFQFFYGYQVDQIRNLIAEWAKRYDYLFSVDSDIVLPHDTLVKMIDADKDIISGLYIQRIPGTHTLEVYKDFMGGTTNIPYEEIEGRGVVEIAGCGFGCCLVKGEVFRRMEYPHFLYKSALDHRNTVSEDTYFCNKARSLGFKVWAHTGIICDHIGQTKYRVQSQLTQEKKEAREIQAQIAADAIEEYGDSQTVLPEKSHLAKIAEIDLLPKAHADYLLKMKNEMGIDAKYIYDIGACVGHWTRKAKDAWPDAEYYLFDAADATVPFMKRWSGSVFHGVLSDEIGKKVKFYEDNDNPGGNSYYKETTGAFTEAHAREKYTITLDRVIKKRNWHWPDLIKMDVQGAELDILRGAPIALRHAQNVILEAQHKDYNEGAPKIEEIAMFMRDNGFELVSNFCQGGVDGDYHFRRIRDA